MKTGMYAYRNFCEKLQVNNRRNITSSNANTQTLKRNGSTAKYNVLDLTMSG
jgi:hypothetical protein